MALSQDTINAQVWKACDTFRGTIDATHKDYILTMLFVKYLSDVLREKREGYAKTYKDNAKRVDRAMALEHPGAGDGDFRLPVRAAEPAVYGGGNGGRGAAE